MLSLSPQTALETPYSWLHEYSGRVILFMILVSIMAVFIFVSKDVAFSRSRPRAYISFWLILCVYALFLISLTPFFSRTGVTEYERKVEDVRSKRKVKLHYRECWILEEIAHKQEASSSDMKDLGARQNIIKTLIEDKKYVEKKGQDELELTEEGEEHLKSAIDFSSEENKTALEYIEIFMGVLIVLFILLLNFRSNCLRFPTLLTYVQTMLLIIIILSFCAGFSFWHGSSADHGFVELRIYNALGDSLMLFCSLILLNALWIVFFLGLDTKWQTAENSMSFFGISFSAVTVLFIWTIWSNLHVDESKGTLGEVLRDIVNLSTNVFRTGKWRIEKSHVVPFCTKGMELTFLSASICGSIIPIIITILG